MFLNPPLTEIFATLRAMHRIAVVGLSPHPHRPSYGVAKAMQGFGCQIVPVRPAQTHLLGEPAYPTLRAVPGAVDMVNVFRRAEEIDALVDEVLAIGAPALWIQTGIVNIPAALRARAAGVWVVMDRCIYQDYKAMQLADKGIV